MTLRNPEVEMNANTTTRNSPRNLSRWAIRLFALSIFGYTCFLVALYVFQDHLIFGTITQAPLDKPPNPDTEVWIFDRPDDSKGVAWFFPHPDSTAETPAPCVVHLHGNGLIIDHQTVLVNRYRALGCSVLLPEYPGYGSSEGSPSQRDILRDCRHFMDRLKSDSRINPDQIILHGQSLGGGVAGQLANDHPPAALILESTFTSLASMASRYYAPEFLVNHPFRTDRVIPTLTSPILIIHGTQDRLINIDHARTLKSLATKSRSVKFIEYSCGHGNLPGENLKEDYWNQIGAFLTDNLRKK